MVNNIKANTSKLLYEKDFYLNNIACSECEGALCNGGIARSVVVKNWISAERKKYLVITVVIIIVFMTVISVMLRVFSRKPGANGGDKKYSLLKV